MSILTKEVEIKPSGKSIQYYRDLGYDAKWHEPLIVMVKDLSKGSNAEIEILCDMCHKNKMNVAYETYNRVVENTGSYVCKECVATKREQTMIDRYGVCSASQLDMFKEQAKLTNIARYGVDNYSKTKECHEKIKQTCLDKYNVEHFARSLEVKEKKSKTLYKNGTTPTSKQQFYIFNLYNQNGKANLNYPISYYNADICFPDEKLDIEVDFGGHNLSVKTGKLTQEEFNQKEIIRNNIIKREGYKQMRIISDKDLLPQDDILLQMLSEARAYFQAYPSHSWYEFNISTSTVRNAEHKDGIPYDFGSLRTIKDNDIQDIRDIPDIETEQQTTTKKGA